MSGRDNVIDPTLLCITSLIRFISTSSAGMRLEKPRLAYANNKDALPSASYHHIAPLVSVTEKVLQPLLSLPSLKHLRTKVTPDFHLTYMGEIWGRNQNDKNG